MSPPVAGIIKTGKQLAASDSLARACAGSFRQPRFPKALNQQLRVCLPAPSDPRRDCKCGIDLKQTRRRLTRLSVTFEMGERGGETVVRYLIGGVQTLSFLPGDDGLVKATKLNQGRPDPSKRVV